MMDEEPVVLAIDDPRNLGNVEQVALKLKALEKALADWVSALPVKLTDEAAEAIRLGNHFKAAAVKDLQLRLTNLEREALAMRKEES